MSIFQYCTNPHSWVLSCTFAVHECLEQLSHKLIKTSASCAIKTALHGEGERSPSIIIPWRAISRRVTTTLVKWCPRPTRVTQPVWASCSANLSCAIHQSIQCSAARPHTALIACTSATQKLGGAVEWAALDQRNHLGSESNMPFTRSDVLHRTLYVVNSSMSGPG